MGKVLIYLILLGTSSYALVQPWIGIVFYYLLAILGPQYIWFWIFSGIRASYYVAISTLLGVALSIVLKRCDFRFLKTRLNAYLLLLWFFVVTSYYLGPYVSKYNPKLGLSPIYLLTNINNIFLFYFCSTLIMDNISKLKRLVYVIVASTVYLIYWANYQYFTANWAQFSFGRLKGPESVDGGSIYRDENAFAMLFVTGIPFIYYLGQSCKSKWPRALCWAIIVFGWHAVFLTGSRGGFLGLAVSIFIIFWNSNRKRLAFVMVIIFYSFFVFQGGSTMKERTGTIDNYESDSSSQMRIIAWKGGLGMISSHPITGVGLGSFITALPSYIDTSPRVAHNTLIQFAAESGVGAGFCYIMAIFLFLKNSFFISATRKRLPVDHELDSLGAINDATTVSFVGLIICSLFLSLNNYEIFYFLLLINNSLSVIAAGKLESAVLHTPCRVPTEGHQCC
jgi:probable O-glycosylation ligase (exosortase A-associated)